MKFIALFKKELREALPWLILAVAILLIFGGIMLLVNIRAGGYDGYRSVDPDRISSHELTRRMPLSGVGGFLFLSTIVLGLALAVRQFWMPGFSKTWAFEIHRSVPRTSILLAKFSAATVAFIFGPGLVWTLFYLYAARPGTFPIPLRGQIFAEGWVLMLVGFILYFGVALSGLSRAKWYSTKMIGLAFSAFMITWAMVQMSFIGCLLMYAIGLLVLVPQITYAILNREF